uniref:CHCH domain-containing protein n=1 Tax=Strigamia maritima TaxID=126957 RepID=T1JGC2_STRMM
MAAASGHEWKQPKTVNYEDVQDPVENMINKTGCLEKHNAVQMCMFEQRDWRKCKKEVTEFKLCIEEHQRKKT